VRWLAEHHEPILEEGPPIVAAVTIEAPVVAPSCAT
jgi:hypothetical protein